MNIVKGTKNKKNCPPKIQNHISKWKRGKYRKLHILHPRKLLI